MGEDYLTSTQTKSMPKVLILDDDADLLEMVDTVLTYNDMTVHCIQKGSALFESIGAVNPDIILMDIFLGDTDGRQLCRQLKTSSSFSHIPVILYSAGNITSESIKEALSDEFIVKPFDINHLVKKINALCLN